MSSPYFKLLFGLNEEALSEFHHDYDSLLGASIALQNLGRFEEAFQKINEAINMEQARFEGYYRRGSADLMASLAQLHSRKNLVGHERYRKQPKPTCRPQGQLVAEEEV